MELVDLNGALQKKMLIAWNGEDHQLGSFFR